MLDTIAPSSSSYNRAAQEDAFRKTCSPGRKIANNRLVVRTLALVGAAGITEKV